MHISGHQIKQIAIYEKVKAMKMTTSDNLHAFNG